MSSSWMHLWISFAIASTAIACASPPAYAIIPQYPECFVFLEFEEGSSALTNSAVDQLNKFVMECSAVYGRTIEIDGHSDALEVPYGGLALSRARAEAARSYLKSTGVLARSLRVQAYGDQQPGARPVGEPYVDAYVHAMNRRVVVGLRPTDQK
jgi:outer membrane protein OmpA-like peptidoglycan-associated protein